MIFLLIGVTGLVVIDTRPRLAKGLLWTMIISIWVFSLPIVGDNLVRTLEKDVLFDGSKSNRTQAIVVLGGEGSLQRCRYAAKLHRETLLPILVSGGSALKSGKTDAERMTRMLERDFNVPVAWQENRAINTIENAALSSKILKAAGVDEVLLVTDGWHMSRAKKLFERQGIRVVPAASGITWDVELTFLDFMPSAEGLGSSRLFFHEAFGLIQTVMLF